MKRKNIKNKYNTNSFYVCVFKKKEYINPIFILKYLKYFLKTYCAYKHTKFMKWSF